MMTSTKTMMTSTPMMVLMTPLFIVASFLRLDDRPRQPRSTSPEWASAMVASA
jgi:hypothetical protein